MALFDWLKGKVGKAEKEVMELGVEGEEAVSKGRTWLGEKFKGRDLEERLDEATSRLDAAEAKRREEEAKRSKEEEIESLKEYVKATEREAWAKEHPTLAAIPGRVKEEVVEDLTAAKEAIGSQLRTGARVGKEVGRIGVKAGGVGGKFFLESGKAVAPVIAGTAKVASGIMLGGAAESVPVRDPFTGEIKFVKKPGGEGLVQVFGGEAGRGFMQAGVRAARGRPAPRSVTPVGLYDLGGLRQPQVGLGGMRQTGALISPSMHTGAGLGGLRKALVPSITSGAVQAVKEVKVPGLTQAASDVLQSWRDGFRTVDELKSTTGLQPEQISRILKALEERGLLVQTSPVSPLKLLSKPGVNLKSMLPVAKVR